MQGSHPRVHGPCSMLGRATKHLACVFSHAHACCEALRSRAMASAYKGSCRDGALHEGGTVWSAGSGAWSHLEIIWPHSQLIVFRHLNQIAARLAIIRNHLGGGRPNQVKSRQVTSSKGKQRQDSSQVESSQIEPKP